MRQHSRLLPLNFEDWDWHDKRYFEWYICRHTDVYYREENIKWPVDFDNWREIKRIEFKCFLLERFANDKIRVGYRSVFPFES